MMTQPHHERQLSLNKRPTPDPDDLSYVRIKPLHGTRDSFGTRLRLQ